MCCSYPVRPVIQRSRRWKTIPWLERKGGDFTHTGNVVDLCGVSVNAGWVENEGSKLPFGVTFLGW